MPLMAVDPTLMPLRQAEPALRIKIVLDAVHVVPAGEEFSAEAAHQT